ncbi:MAG TPA: TlpA disulfide reductase family protein [Candidatus Saccharimonadales bacterium]|nr:TlpA disulfide reductase family protein [Candidatus Saccharimonadales bacterium]
MTHIVAGGTAPTFSLEGLDGKHYSLSSRLLLGPAVLVFFKISCPVCQFTLPFLERLYKRYGGDGISFLAVGQDDARATRQFAGRHGLTFPVLLDESHYPVSNAYGLTNVPTLFLVEPSGKARLVGMGFDKKDLEAIAAWLAEYKQTASAPLFRPDEAVPAHKPG